MRQEFSRKVRAAAFMRCNGVCEGCGYKLHPGRFQYHHVIEAHDDGPATLENCLVLCRACHAPLTIEFVRGLRKSERIRDKASGAMLKSRSPLPGGRNSAWKKTFSNGWVRRET